MKAYVLFLMVTLAMVFAGCEKEFIHETENQAELKNGKSDHDKLIGFDEWGFNFNAQLFDNYLINVMFGDPKFAGMPHYRQMIYQGEGEEFWDEVINNYPYFVNFMPPDLLDCQMKMKWNEDLLSKSGIYPESWVDSEAWIVFHYKMNTEFQKWTQIRTLVARQSTDYLEGDRWYDKDGNEIGKKSYYWNDLIIIRVINNGDNPFVPDVMPDDYIRPKGEVMGKYSL